MWMRSRTVNEETRARSPLLADGASGVGYVDKSLYIHTYVRTYWLTYASVRNSPDEWACGALDASFVRIMDTRTTAIAVAGFPRPSGVEYPSYRGASERDNNLESIRII